LEAGRQGVKVFLDSSVLLSACGSERSLSRLITEIAEERKWVLVSAAYCRAETTKNLGKFGIEASGYWKSLQRKVEWAPNALTTRRPLLLTASKDKPVLISALAERCDLLLTLDKGDFEILLSTEAYGMEILTPRDFLVGQGLGENPLLSAKAYRASLQAQQNSQPVLELRSGGSRKPCGRAGDGAGFH
jgi:hypothetical protein